MGCGSGAWALAGDLFMTHGACTKWGPVNGQESTAREKEMAAILEENVQRTVGAGRLVSHLVRLKLPKARKSNMDRTLHLKFWNVRS